MRTQPRWNLHVQVSACLIAAQSLWCVCIWSRISHAASMAHQQASTVLLSSVGIQCQGSSNVSNVVFVVGCSSHHVVVVGFLCGASKDITSAGFLNCVGSCLVTCPHHQCLCLNERMLLLGVTVFLLSFLMSNCFLAMIACKCCLSSCHLVLWLGARQIIKECPRSFAF
jgi:hypothetical protein